MTYLAMALVARLRQLLRLRPLQHRLPLHQHLHQLQCQSLLSQRQPLQRLHLYLSLLLLHQHQ